MSKSEIQAWISSTGISEIDGEPSTLAWQRDHVLDDWPHALECANRQIMTSRTRIRVHFIREELFPLLHANLSSTQILDIFELLSRTYPRYSDAPSRHAVEAILTELIQRDKLSDGDNKGRLDIAEKIVVWLESEVGTIAKPASTGSHASTDLFVLLSWSCLVYTVCLQIRQQFASCPSWRILVNTMALLLHLIQGSTHSKQSVQRSALVRVRRALRVAPSMIETLIHTTLNLTRTSQTPLAYVPLLGTTVDVLIRLKNMKDEPSARLSVQNKAAVLTLYTGTVLMSKTAVPGHVLTAFNGFIRTFITFDDFKENILPTIEKALLRSPEISLDVITQFLHSYPQVLDCDTFRRILVPVLNSSKSSNPIIRNNAVDLFKILIGKQSGDSDQAYAVQELLGPPKAGKSVGPDHRIALYAMLASVSPSTVSATIINTAIPLLAKESHDVALAILASALPLHLSYLLDNGIPIPLEVTSSITREMANVKPTVRRAFCSVAGGALWESGDIKSEIASSFAKSLLPSFEGNLKTVSTNPLVATGGPLEGYVALSILLGPYSRSSAFETPISTNPFIQAIHANITKPSFLLLDKVYQKIIDPEDEKWLLRAASNALLFFETELTKNEVLRTQLGLVFVHLAIEGHSLEIRREVITTLQSSTSRLPLLTNRVLRDALTMFLANGKGLAVTRSEEQDILWNKHTRLSALLLSCMGFGDNVDMGTRECTLIEHIIAAHHYLTAPPSRQLWIEMCQKAKIDPCNLAEQHTDELLKEILTASTVSGKYGFAEASYHAVTTLTFIAPIVFIPRVVEQLHSDLDPSSINQLTDVDFGVFFTPEGQTYINVLASKRVDDYQLKKGKDAKMAKWEDDVRKSLASKKPPAPSTLTKQEQAAVHVQLEKELQIRERVLSIKVKMERGLQLIKSLVSANVDELKPHISAIASLLTEGALTNGSPLVGQLAFNTYLDLAKCCSERLGTFRSGLSVAILRSLTIPGVPEQFQAEPLDALVIRVLYRLRSLSEQSPFDAATYSFISPLLHQVLLQGGVSVKEDEAVQEQIKLVLDIINFHSSKYVDEGYPRKATLQGVLHVIRHQPMLAKEASSILVDLGEVMHSTFKLEELGILLFGSLHQESYLRNACLQTLQPFDLTDLEWSPEIWIACHDDDEQNARLAKHIWEDNGLDVPEAFLRRMMDFLVHENAYVRDATAAAIAEAVGAWPRTITTVVEELQRYYHEKVKILAPELDEYGMLVTQSIDRTDPWQARLAVAHSFRLLASHFTDNEVDSFFRFLIQDGPLGDREASVRRAMLAAGIAVIDAHGAARLADLIKMFENHLGLPSPATEAGDQIKEAVVILFGRVGRHLTPTDPRIPAIVERLVEALRTPSEQVQIAVSECVAPLAKLIKPNVSSLVDSLFSELFSAPKYAARRGAAYGIAGVIKGSGLSAMKEFSVIARLRVAAEDKKQFEPRQGAMFAFETLSASLGRNFEPYVTYVLPLLLAAFGDATNDVREAAQDAARVIMGNLSGYGVKLILPSLLSGLEEKLWRSKRGSIELLGMMAYCSPKQLSLSLPIVIPRLTGVLTDSHVQVRAAANKSLKQFGEVISNPEIQSLVPVLLKALVDPAKTSNALSSLLKTSFIHYIDRSSLALVVPILERGLRERGADVKKKAAQIVGNLASLTDSKDFVPYLSTLLPMVHTVLIDPVPEARATAAKALGTLVERMGEIHFPDLIPGLLRTLKTDTSSVDRQGAAQGLSEVLCGLGMERLEGLLPDIITNAQSPRPTVREGFMSLLVFLPATFGARFQPHLPRIISPILSGLSDTEEYVREAAMRAGRMIVTNYSLKAIDLLLPALEQGMFDPGWRIRQSSITLVGELLFKVSGISGKTELNEEDGVAEASAAETSRRALGEVLGPERRDRILSALYLVRQDSVLVVRQSSIHIWKALVHNTPRTVREILAELINQIIYLISGSDVEQQETAGKTTAELCRKFGEKIMGEIIPILRTKSTSQDSRTREGVCLMLCELVQSSTDGQRESHEDDIISMVRVSLVDDEANVRVAAAKAFDVLQEHLGAQAIDQTIPTLLEALRQPGKGSGTALQALREVMSVRASTVFPILIPTLTAMPMTVFNARALASLITVAGNALSRRLTVILNATVRVIEDEPKPELAEAIDAAMKALCTSINDAEGLNALMMALLGWAKHELPRRRVSAFDIFAMFCEESELDFSLYRVDWIRQLVASLEDPEVTVHTAAWKALDVFVRSIPKDELEPLVVPLRRSIESTGTPGHSVPGFSLPKGVSPMVPIIIAGLTMGSNEQRENAALAIGDLVERTDENAIKPYVVSFTGPLIRVATQATTFPPAVKTGILSALTSMLERIPTFVKPFFPQLQRTFVKSANDPASVTVRTKAASGLGVLMKHQPRVDPVVTELLTSIKASDDSVGSSLVLALANVVRSASQNISEKARESCIELVFDAFRSTHDEYYVQSVATLFKSLSVYPNLLRPIVETYLVAGTTPSVLSSRILLTVLSPDEYPSSEDPQNVFQRLSLLRSVAQKIQESAGNEKPSISRPAREARELVKTLNDDTLQGFSW